MTFRNQNDSTPRNFFQKLEPFDILALVLIVGGFFLITVSHGSDSMFQSGKELIISVSSAYAGKRWNQS